MGDPLQLQLRTPGQMPAAEGRTQALMDAAENAQFEGVVTLMPQVIAEGTAVASGVDAARHEPPMTTGVLSASIFRVGYGDGYSGHLFASDNPE